MPEKRAEVNKTVVPLQTPKLDRVVSLASLWDFYLDVNENGENGDAERANVNVPVDFAKRNDQYPLFLDKTTEWDALPVAPFARNSMSDTEEERVKSEAELEGVQWDESSLSSVVPFTSERRPSIDSQGTVEPLNGWMSKNSVTRKPYALWWNSDGSGAFHSVRAKDRDGNAAFRRSSHVSTDSAMCSLHFSRSSGEGYDIWTSPSKEPVNSGSTFSSLVPPSASLKATPEAHKSAQTSLPDECTHSSEENCLETFSVSPGSMFRKSGSSREIDMLNNYSPVSTPLRPAEEESVVRESIWKWWKKTRQRDQATQQVTENRDANVTPHDTVQATRDTVEMKWEKNRINTILVLNTIDELKSEVKWCKVLPHEHAIELSRKDTQKEMKSVDKVSEQCRYDKVVELRTTTEKETKLRKSAHILGLLQLFLTGNSSAILIGCDRDSRGVSEDVVMYAIDWIVKELNLSREQNRTNSFEVTCRIAAAKSLENKSCDLLSDDKEFRETLIGQNPLHGPCILNVQEVILSVNKTEYKQEIRNALQYFHKEPGITTVILTLGLKQVQNVPGVSILVSSLQCILLTDPASLVKGGSATSGVSIVVQHALGGPCATLVIGCLAGGPGCREWACLISQKTNMGTSVPRRCTLDDLLRDSEPLSSPRASETIDLLASSRMENWHPFKDRIKRRVLVAFNESSSHEMNGKNPHRPLRLHQHSPPHSKESGGSSKRRSSKEKKVSSKSSSKKSKRKSEENAPLTTDFCLTSTSLVDEGFNLVVGHDRDEYGNFPPTTLPRIEQPFLCVDQIVQESTKPPQQIPVDKAPTTPSFALESPVKASRRPQIQSPDCSPKLPLALATHEVPIGPRMVIHEKRHIQNFIIPNYSSSSQLEQKMETPNSNNLLTGSPTKSMPSFQLLKPPPARLPAGGKSVAQGITSLVASSRTGNTKIENETHVKEGNVLPRNALPQCHANLASTQTSCSIRESGEMTSSLEETLRSETQCLPHPMKSKNAMSLQNKELTLNDQKTQNLSAHFTGPLKPPSSNDNNDVDKDHVSTMVRASSSTPMSGKLYLKATQSANSILHSVHPPLLHVAKAPMQRRNEKEEEEEETLRMETFFNKSQQRQLSEAIEKKILKSNTQSRHVAEQDNNKKYEDQKMHPAVNTAWCMTATTEKIRAAQSGPHGPEAEYTSIAGPRRKIKPSSSAPVANPNERKSLGGFPVKKKVEPLSRSHVQTFCDAASPSHLPSLPSPLSNTVQKSGKNRLVLVLNDVLDETTPVRVSVDKGNNVLVRSRDAFVPRRILSADEVVRLSAKETLRESSEVKKIMEMFTAGYTTALICETICKDESENPSVETLAEWKFVVEELGKLLAKNEENGCYYEIHFSLCVLRGNEVIKDLLMRNENNDNTRHPLDLCFSPLLGTAVNGAVRVKIKELSHAQRIFIFLKRANDYMQSENGVHALLLGNVVLKQLKAPENNSKEDTQLILSSLIITSSIYSPTRERSGSTEVALKLRDLQKNPYIDASTGKAKRLFAFCLEGPCYTVGCTSLAADLNGLVALRAISTIQVMGSLTKSPLIHGNVQSIYELISQSYERNVSSLEEARKSGKDTKILTKRHERLKKYMEIHKVMLNDPKRAEPIYVTGEYVDDYWF